MTNLINCPFCGSRPYAVTSTKKTLNTTACSSSKCKIFGIGIDTRTWNRWPSTPNRTLETTAISSSELMEEVRCYLVAAEDGSMSKNNSEALAGELLESMKART